MQGQTELNSSPSQRRATCLNNCQLDDGWQSCHLVHTISGGATWWTSRITGVQRGNLETWHQLGMAHGVRATHRCPRQRSILVKLKREKERLLHPPTYLLSRIRQPTVNTPFLYPQTASVATSDTMPRFRPFSFSVQGWSAMSTAKSSLQLGPSVTSMKQPHPAILPTALCSETS